NSGEGRGWALRGGPDARGRRHPGGEDVVPAKGTARTGHPSPAREREIRLRTGVRGVPAGSAGEREKRGGRLKKKEQASGGDRQRSVSARCTQVDDAGNVDERNPVEGDVRRYRLGRAGSPHGQPPHWGPTGAA